MWNPARQYNMNVPIYFCIYVQIKEKSLYGEGANARGYYNKHPCTAHKKYCS